MPDEDYYTSEEFIWDNLTKQAERGIRGLYSTWKKVRRISPFIITWPATTVRDKEGVELEGAVVRELEEDPGTWTVHTLEAIKLTNAYALLRVQQQEDRVQVILESQHGARCWVIPITQSGDVRVLGHAKRADGTAHIGLLWRPSSVPS